MRLNSKVLHFVSISTNLMIRILCWPVEFKERFMPLRLRLWRIIEFIFRLLCFVYIYRGVRIFYEW